MGVFTQYLGDACRDPRRGQVFGAEHERDEILGQDLVGVNDVARVAADLAGMGRSDCGIEQDGLAVLSHGPPMVRPVQQRAAEIPALQRTSGSVARGRRGFGQRERELPCVRPRGSRA